MKVEPILLTTVRVLTFTGVRSLTNASGFFFERDERIFLVTNRHVFFDKPSYHFPDRVVIDLHVGGEGQTSSIGFSIPLYQSGIALWHAECDTAGEVDVAVIELERNALPSDLLYRAFTPAHLPLYFESFDVGSPVLVVGFPLGFHDQLHHLPIVRQGVIASSFGLRFQGMGYFLTDARTHRGSSGAPVVVRGNLAESGTPDLPWLLLGVHSTRLDMGARDLMADEALGLNSAWYSDILMTLTEPIDAVVSGGT